MQQVIFKKYIYLNCVIPLIGIQGGRIIKDVTKGLQTRMASSTLLMVGENWR